METDQLQTLGQAQKGWQDDVLDRSGFAEFLTHSLTEQTRVISERQQRGLTIALDAEWGAGKTFFVKHWAADLERQGFPVVFFDAWKNDLGEEPAVALMAAINSELREWFKRLPVKEHVEEHAKALMKSSVRQLRKAFLPATTVIAKGVLKKITGVAGSDLKGAYSSVDDDEDTSDESDHEKSTDTATEGTDENASEKDIESSLDVIFDRILQEQDKRIEAIERFKSTMVDTVDLLHQEAAAKIPFFVFVDELDRCRPSYAISLLEEIKHIFGLPKVCFVVSMNLAQLTHSIRAVYGPNFDGEHYLKRYFDQTYSVPPPANIKHIDLLLAEHPGIAERRHSLGLPEESSNKVGKSIALIFDSFNLDLRSQKQVFRIAENAAAAIDGEKPIYVIWLFFLCALIHKNQQVYSELMRKDLNYSEFHNIFNEFSYENKKIPYRNARESSAIGLSELLWKFYHWSRMKAPEINKIAMEESAIYYPDSIILELDDELPSSYRTNNPPAPSISHYIRIVKYAGYTQS